MRLVVPLLSCLTPATLTAQETAGVSPLPLGVTVAADLVSTYVFRAVDVPDGPAVQAWATVSLGNTWLSFIACRSFAVLDRVETVPYSTSLTCGGVDEIDLTAAFGRTVGVVLLGAGFIAYLHHPSDQQGYVTQEGYASLGLPGVPLTPTFTAYYAFDETDDQAADPDVLEGASVLLCLARSLPVGMPFDLGASIGWTNQDALRPDPGIHDLNLAASVPVVPGAVTLTPTVGYTSMTQHSTYYRGEHKNTVWTKLQLKLLR